MARTKKQVFENVEQVKEYLLNNYTFAKLVDELAQFKHFKGKYKHII
jgi:ribosomal protein L17